MSESDADRELLSAWRSGDSDAGSRLFRRHFASVFRFFQNKLDQDVDDLIQRTFLGCLELGDRLDELRSFKAYLLGIARLQLLRYLREKGARVRTDDVSELSIADTLGSPSAVIARHEEERLLLAALRGLPLDLQIAVELFYWERMKLVDIAGVLGVPEGTIKSRLHRAKALLREHVEALPGREDVCRSLVANLDQWADGLRDQLATAIVPSRTLS